MKNNKASKYFESEVLIIHGLLEQVEDAYTVARLRIRLNSMEHTLQQYQTPSDRARAADTHYSDI